MSNTYFIRWKSLVNGRSGKGSKLFARQEAEDLAEELNREFPQIQHEAVKSTVQGAVKSTSEGETEASAPNPARELALT